MRIPVAVREAGGWVLRHWPSMSASQRRKVLAFLPAPSNPVEEREKLVEKEKLKFLVQFEAACRMAHLRCTPERVGMLASIEQYRVSRGYEPLTTRDRARFLAKSGV